MLISGMFIHAQCITNIDFNSWNQAGYTANGNWTVQNGGAQVYQTVNGNPTFFISPFKLMCVKITGNFNTSNNDDDFMGFVFSFLDPLGQSDNYNGWLFDWKQITQPNGIYNGNSGKSLCRMDGAIPSGSYIQTFWGHQNTPAFTVVQNDFGGAGWVRNFDHYFELRLSYTRALIYIDGQLVFDQPDCFLPGYFGFYNYSQASCTYSNFNFEPYVEFSVLTPQICLGDTGKFQFLDICQDSSFYDFSTFQSLTWDFGDGNVEVNNNIDITNINPNHIYTQPGTYSVILSLMDYQGCIGLDTQQIVVSPLPSVNFSVSDVCLGTASSFTNQSVIAGDSITAFNWTFENGYSSSLENHQYTFATCDTFNVSLIATSNKGCVDSTTKPAIVLCVPTATYSADTVCQGQATVFANTSSGNISGWNWDFGDSDTSIIQNPSHIYTNCGTYNSKLVVTNDAGCKDTMIKTIIVDCLPIAKFGSADVCFNQAINFSDSSTVSIGNITDWSWDFGDTSPLNPAVNPVYTYTNHGTYSVSLIVTSNKGCKDTLTKSIEVHPLPVAQFSMVNVCDGTEVQFNYLSTIPASDTIQIKEWDFGDGNLLNNTDSTSHLYAATGSYPVQLSVVSDFGCADSITKTVSIYPNPVANFTAIDTFGCSPLCVSFFDASSIVSGNNTGWLWNFGDGSAAGISQDTNYCYTNNTSPASYSVTLIVTSDSACADTISKSNYITVNPNPVAQFSAANVCDGNTVQFNYLSTLPNNTTIQDIIWNFGDGNVLNNIEDTSHIYTAPGSYTVGLSMVTDSGCTDSVSKIITVNPNPVVIFSATDTVGCGPLCTSFQDFTSLGSGTIFSSEWSLGDGSIINSSAFDHCYTNDSVYLPLSFSVTLTVTSDSGCVNSLTKNNYITVYPNPDANFMIHPQATTITNPFVSITDLSVGAEFWSWDFSDGSATIITDLNTPLGQRPSAHTFPDTGIYTITLITSTQYGCIDTAYKTITIEPEFVFYIPNAFSPDDDDINDTFSGKGIFINSYEMTIFDRWGNLVFFTDDIDKPWDGRANYGTEIAQRDVYIYSIQLTDFTKKTHNYKGIVTLLR